MALRNQPYFPLYVQDYLTDEKLNMCSWKTQGIYIKILCILHKQQEYGSIILFKQTSKQILDFASLFVKQIPCSIEDMEEAINELIFYNILIIKDNKLFQKRMVKDGEVSLKRSNAGKIGGGNPNLFKQTSKQKVKQSSKQITENEYEYENKYENINERELIFKEDVFKNTSYSEDTLSDFFRYWSETNKQKTKMRFELEKTWDIKKRLITWEKRSNNFSKHEEKKERKML
jgi:hypothetical protein